MQGLVVLKREDMAKGSKVTTAVKAAAAATKGKMVWVLVDTAGEAYEQISEFFGIKAADTLPKVRPRCCSLISCNATCLGLFILHLVALSKMLRYD